MRSLLLPPHIPALLLALLPLSACGSDDDDADGDSPREQLVAARDRWEGSGIASYFWVYERSCLCPSLGFAVLVTDGEVTRVDGFAGTKGALPAPDDPDSQEPPYGTIDDVFDTIESALDDGVDILSVDYDDRTGRPFRFSIDPDEATFDDQLEVTISTFDEA